MVVWLNEPQNRNLKRLKLVLKFVPLCSILCILLSLSSIIIKIAKFRLRAALSLSLILSLIYIIVAKSIMEYIFSQFA
ncbi:hypothetical protein KFK09_018895 [Dendrobium nobile]|uniref:Uncharacterized protein n=1 Tax=Dendrobium nobile TaxID=94219 RepID=A0A8T3AWJ6_DENNO|nr:hypothetical protein KFK09_018895 [Dendrobium nobile]